MGISNAQYMDIMYQYDQIRLKNHRILEERRAMVYEKIPGIQAVQEQIIQLSADYARSGLFNPDMDGSEDSSYTSKKAV